MDVDFNDPKSIGAWVRLCPERHLAQLDGLRRLPLFQELKRRIAGGSPGAPTAAARVIGQTTAQAAGQGALL
jgi:hypothetical protein